jgi:hypothetical protein
MGVIVEGKNTFQLMGESHIRGIVDGEAMDAMQICHEPNSCDKAAKAERVSKPWQLPQNAHRSCR